MAFNNGYPPHPYYCCIADYVFPYNEDKEWKECPNCGLKPKVWVFNNGEFTACGCWKDIYDHFGIQAESIMSIYRRTNGKIKDKYDDDALRKNWNHWCVTGKIN